MMPKAALLDSKPACARFLLDAARELLADVGYGGMSMRQLAGHVGILPGSLYHHVDDKQDLLFQVLLDLLEERDAALKKASRRVAPLVELRRFIGFLLARQFSHSRESTLLEYESRHLRDDLRSQITQRIEGLQAQLRLLLQRGFQAGVFREIDPHAASLAILALVKTADALRDGPGNWTPSSIEDHLYRMSLRLLDATPSD